MESHLFRQFWKRGRAWLKALVSKTRNPEGYRGSNPLASAIFDLSDRRSLNFDGLAKWQGGSLQSSSTPVRFRHPSRGISVTGGTPVSKTGSEGSSPSSPANFSARSLTDRRPSSKRAYESSSLSEQAWGHGDNGNTTGLHPVDPSSNLGASRF